MSIQGNPLGLREIEARLFDVYDIDNRTYLNAGSIVEWSKKTSMPMVDIVDWDKIFSFDSDEELRRYAEGVYPNGRQREGVVIRPIVEQYIGGMRASFKVLNLLYKES